MHACSACTHANTEAHRGAHARTHTHKNKNKTAQHNTHTHTHILHIHRHYLRTYLSLVFQRCTIYLTASLTGWSLDRFLLPGVFSLVEACMLLLEETDCDIRQVATRFVGNLQWDKKSPKVIHGNVPVCADVHVGLYTFCKSRSLPLVLSEIFTQRWSAAVCLACTCWMLSSVAWIIYFWDQCSVWNGILVCEFVSSNTVVDLGYSLVFGKSQVGR